MQERLQAGEGGLSKLAEGNRFVGLKTLEPGAEFELMTPARERDVILEGVQVSRNGQIAPIVASGEAELRRRIGGRASTDDNSAYGMSDEEARNACGRRAWGRLTRKEIAGARKSHSRAVHQRRRKNVRLLQTKYLLAKRHHVAAEWI